MAPTHPVLSVEGRSVAWRDREFLRGESEPSGGRVRHSCPGVATGGCCTGSLGAGTLFLRKRERPATRGRSLQKDSGPLKLQRNLISFINWRFAERTMRTKEMRGFPGCSFLFLPSQYFQPDLDNLIPRASPTAGTPS